MQSTSNTTPLELLAPARNADIGIAAVDCGADAVYIAGPSFGARKDAGNPISEVGRLCTYAHRFGVRIFLTVNIILEDEELEQVHAMMLQAQRAGVDAFIIRDERICTWKDITVPLHASTQCAIRTPERARHFERLGCSRIVLERQLSLESVRAIREAVGCELEFFVHGALCVCYSGECTLSEHITAGNCNNIAGTGLTGTTTDTPITPRSADRGECIQACRSLYDLVDESGRVLVRNKALLSLKDFNLKERLASLADAGVISFKIEGRLKNASYVKNVTREYSDALDALVRANSGRWRRASQGRVTGGFRPDSRKTFNRGYTQLFIDGERGRWSSMDIPKSAGEKVGKVERIVPRADGSVQLTLALERGVTLKNGDGFSFATADGVTGFRADIAEGKKVVCKSVSGLRPGIVLMRNVSAEFEKAIESNPCRREIPVKLRLKIAGGQITADALREDSARVQLTLDAPEQQSLNPARTEAMIREGLGKRSGIYAFALEGLDAEGAALPLLSASFINGIRRQLSQMLEEVPVGGGAAAGTAAGAIAGANAAGIAAGAAASSEAPLPALRGTTLMRSKYCIKYELGLCPKNFDCKPTGNLYLRNNGRTFALGFDCKACEMTVTKEV